MIEPAVRQPSIAGIFAWANARFAERWPGFFAIALMSAIIPVARMAMTHEHTPKASTTAGWVFALAQELVLLLTTAAIVLFAAGPRESRAVDAARGALSNTLELVLVRITTSLVRVVPTLFLAAVALKLGGGPFTLVFGLLLAPLAFICRLAYAGAVLERSGPIDAILDAFRRARLSGFGVVVWLTLLFAFVEQVPPLVFGYAANAIFPPVPVPVSWPHAPGFPQPSLPDNLMMRPGAFGSAIPWGAHVVMLLADMPFFAYVTVLYAAAALAFADTEPPKPVYPTR